MSRFVANVPVVADTVRFGFDPPPPPVTDTFQLEPLGPEHNERDHEAWMSSIDHIHATPGFPDGRWPAPMSLDENLADLEMHHREFVDRSGYTYSILDGDEVVGCLYIYPTDPGDDVDASVRSWVRASRAELDGPTRQRIASWLADDWPIDDFRY